MCPKPVDRNGRRVAVGALVRIVDLSGSWLEQLPPDERIRVESMVGEVFPVEEIDDYGQPWVRKNWPNESEGTCQSHSIALAPREMELVDDSSSPRVVA
jgi:hypothetical protein